MITTVFLIDFSYFPIFEIWQFNTDELLNISIDILEERRTIIILEGISINTWKVKRSHGNFRFTNMFRLQQI
jgi:hypothetical protein